MTRFKYQPNWVQTFLVGTYLSIKQVTISLDVGMEKEQKQELG